MDQTQQGRVIGGKYRLGRELGSGGMGYVHEAEHIALGERVAMKFLRSHIAAYPEFTARFLREAKSFFRIDSEHVVRMIDVDTDETGAPYLVMQLAQGEPLDAVLERRGALDVRIAAEVIAQVCDGLGEAHRIGIVHRDVKPSNVMITRASSGRLCVKLLDFGIAQGVEQEQRGESGTRLTVAQAVIGTLSYMAPEQLRSAREADPRSDVWSIGIMLFEVLTGRLPWSSTSPGDLVLRQHTEGVPMHRLGAHIPPEVVAITLRCLAMNPDDRFFDAREVADALAPWRADLGAYALLVRPEEDEAPTERADFASVRQMLRHSDSARIAAERAARTAPLLRVAAPSSIPPAMMPAEPIDALPIERVPLGLVLLAAVSSLLVVLVVLLVTIASRDSHEAKAAPARIPERAPAPAAVPSPDDNPPPIAASSATSAPSSRPSSKQAPKTRASPSINAPHVAPPASTSIYTDKW